MILEWVVELMMGEIGIFVEFIVCYKYFGEVEEILLLWVIIKMEIVLGECCKMDDIWDYFIDWDLGIGYVWFIGFGCMIVRELFGVFN